MMLADKRRDGHCVAVALLRQSHHHRIFLRYEPRPRSPQRVSQAHDVAVQSVIATASSIPFTACWHAIIIQDLSLMEV